MPLVSDKGSRFVPMGRALVAVIVGLATGWTCLVHVPFDSLNMSGMETPTLIVAAMLGTALAYWAVSRLALPRWAHRSRRAKVLWVAGSLTGAALLVLVIPIAMPPYPYAPVQWLDIVATGERNPAARASEVWVHALIRPDHSRVTPEQFVLEGDWEVRDGVPVSYQRQPATLRWRGRLRGNAELQFVSHPWSGVVEVTWNGAVQTIDLYADSAATKVIALPVKHATRLARVLQETSVFGAHVVALGTLVFLVSGWLATRTSRVTSAPPSRWAWARYALPCVVAWTVALVAFWPAMMSSDSIDQWQQMISGKYYDSHPAFHTMNNWLITRVWLSPTAIAIAQIIALSAAAGWGLSRMRHLGLPVWLAWATSLAFAVSPVNSKLIVTLWKDVPFGVAFLVFTFLLLEAVSSDGDCLKRRFAWLGLGLVAALIALYRHNGVPVAFGTLVILIFAYRRYWRRALLALGVTTICVWAVRGPLYQALNVRPHRISSYLGPTLHYIAAHVNAGTPLTEDERKLLQELRPPDSWPYQPFRRDLLRTDGRLNVDAVHAHRQELTRLFLSLSLRNPRVSLRHLYWQSSVVWRIRHPANSYYSTALGGFYEGEVLTIVKNSAGFAPQPISRLFRQQFAEWLGWLGGGDWFWLSWRPALYLYIALGGTVIAAARTGRWKYLTLMLPIGIHSLIIAWFAPSQDFRYQYPIYLVGLLMGPFLIWSAGTRDGRQPTASQGNR